VLRPYRQVLRTHGLPVPLLASFAGALPIGMLSLGVLLFVRLHGQSFAAAGIVAGCLSIGSGAGVVAQGAGIDRRGQTVVLASAGPVCAASLAALVAVVAHGGPGWLAGGLAFASGACIPATPTAARSLCAMLVEDPHLRVTAYAMLAMASTTAAILGPLVVSALLAGGGEAAVLMTAVLAAGTSILYALTPAARHWAPPFGASRRRFRIRSLASPGMRTLAIASAASGTVLGAIAIAIPAVALADHTAALAGKLFAISAAGDLACGAFYGGRSWRLPPHARLVAALLALAASCAIFGAGTGAVPVAAVGMAAFGAAGAATGITLTTLIHHAAPQDAVTESYAMIICAALTGTALGNLASGALIGIAGVRPVFMVAASGAVAAAACTAARSHTLR
jgi:MFS family permease